ncbi:MAG: hypothetical protein KGH98_00080 [Candidatus Micrarchaeota archaeon]|nr:hypothetical protein [Candidatus Micrarchaeota archaeon]
MPLRVIEYRQLLQILSMFAIVQFAGLFLAIEFFSGTSYQQATTAEVASSSINALFYIGYIVVFAIIIVMILRIYKGNVIFKLMEGFVLFFASLFVFLALIAIALNYLQGSSIYDIVYGNSPISIFAVSAALALGLVAAKNLWPGLRNTAAIIASIGVGFVLGISFSFLASMIFICLLAVYDFIAVFITKHMVSMAQAMSKNNMAFLVGVSEVKAVPQSSLPRAQLDAYRKELAESGAHKFRIPNYTNMVPIAARVELGTGDLAVPLMVAISAYKLFLNFVLSISIILGAIFGLLLTMFILKRYMRALPAIPPLLFGIAVAVLAYFAALHL